MCTKRLNESLTNEFVKPTMLQTAGPRIFIKLLCRELFIFLIMDLGPDVQSIISLTCSLRGHLIKCFATSLPNTLKFFVEKMKEASHIFLTKNNGVFQILTFEILTKR